jgi:hypothetical protein
MEKVWGLSVTQYTECTVPPTEIDTKSNSGQRILKIRFKTLIGHKSRKKLFRVAFWGVVKALQDMLFTPSLKIC